MKLTRHILIITAMLAGAHAPAFAQQPQPQPSRPAQQPAAAAAVATKRGPQEIVKEGVRVEFTVEPVAGDKNSSPLAGQEATVRFRISDTATKTPLGGSRPSAWMSLRASDGATSVEQCRAKVQGFMQGSLRARPDVDLNTYYLLALNEEPNISVIDPLLGFGGSKLVTLVFLKSPGEDWALTADRQRLFVSMPAANQVAVVDTNTWKVVANVDTAARPARLALQPDEKYLWVTTGGEGNDPAASGVTVLDAASLKVAAQIQTGAGRHELAFSPDNKFAYVTNSEAGTLSVLDAQRLAKVKDVKTGAQATHAAYSPLGRAVYVVDESAGAISVVGGSNNEVLTRINVRPGARSVRFAPGGRYGFVPNSKDSVVHVFDASTNRPVHDIPVGGSPDQVAFTSAFAYVRSTGSEEVSIIRLSTVGKEPDVLKFPGGQSRPDAAPAFRTIADAIAPAPEGNAALVTNPADRQIYYYSEGMAAPMGSFQNYKRVPRAVRVVDRSLREESAGVYSTTVRLPKSGRYDVSFLLDSPRVVHCFEAEAAPNPALKEERKAALRVEYLTRERRVSVGEPHTIRFRLTDALTGEPKAGLKDVRALTFLAPGTWQQRDWARDAGQGVYELSVKPPEEGVYMVFIEVPSQGIAFRQLPYLTLEAGAKTPAKEQ
ncbi:MAG TPA: cytochrome D1 domain-containing protein [Pyrinomonadaceae bacterium]